MKILLLFLLAFLYCLETYSMQFNNDLWTKIIACSTTPAKNALGKCSTTLHTLYSKNNINLYLQAPLVLTYRQGEYALMLCAYKNHIKSVKNLLRQGMSTHYSYCALVCSPLALARYYCNETMVELLKKYPYSDDLGFWGKEVLPNALAAFFGDIETLQKYVNSPHYDPVYVYDVEEDTMRTRSRHSGATLLFLAIFRGHHNAVDLLLTHPKTIEYINSGTKTCAAFGMALSKDDSITLKKLIAIPSLDKSNGERHVYYCAKHGKIECLKILLGYYNISVNKMISSHFLGRHVDNSALTVAAYYGHTPVVALLLRNKKITVNIMMYDRVQGSFYNYTPLYFAALNGHTKVVKLLLDHPDINPFLSLKNGSTPLHIACKKGHVDIVRLLVHHAPQLLHIKTKDKQESAYQVAYHHKQYDVVKFLLEYFEHQKS